MLSGPGDLPNPEIEPVSLMTLALAGRFFTTSATWEAHFSLLVLSIDILQIFILLYITATHTYITITLSKYFYINLFLVNIQCLHDHNPAQFSSVQSLNLILCNPMDHSTPGLPVHHELLEFTQIHVHCVGDTIQPSHYLSSPSPPAFNLSQHQGLFK